MAISDAMTDAQRAELQALFEGALHDIAPNAIPKVEHDHLYAPLVLGYHDPETGQLPGAALTSRSQAAISTAMMRRPEYTPVMDRHIWFGNATRDLGAKWLREFYARHGFTVLPDSRPLPDLPGRSWVLPTAEQSALFHKQIKKG